MVIGSQFHDIPGWSMKQKSIRSVFIGGSVAGSCALARYAASSNTYLAIFAGWETFHSIGVSSDEGPFKARNRWSVISNRLSGSGKSEEESDEPDEMRLGICPRPVNPSFPFPMSMIPGEYGVGSAKGLGRGE